MDFQIISDGSCDLTLELREKYNIQVVPFYVSFDGENDQKEIDEIDIRDVYERMVKEPDVSSVRSEFCRCFSASCKRRTCDHLYDHHQYSERCV